MTEQQMQALMRLTETVESAIAAASTRSEHIRLMQMRADLAVLTAAQQQPQQV